MLASARSKLKVPLHHQTHQSSILALHSIPRYFTCLAFDCRKDLLFIEPSFQYLMEELVGSCLLLFTCFY